MKCTVIRNGVEIATGYGRTPEEAREDAQLEIELAKLEIPGTRPNPNRWRQDWRTA